MKKPRLDELLVARGLCATLHDAQAAVMAGEVVVGEHRADSSGMRISPDAKIRMKQRACPFVSRGGMKLAGALDAFGVDPRGLRCADLGCSTGGFTDCLLGRGAAHVVAVDVGRADFAWALRNDARVTLLENTNVRGLSAADLGGEVALAVADLSFIALAAVLPDIYGLLGEGASAVLLVKPQFELPAALVGDGGVVCDVSAHEEALRLAVDAARETGFSVRGLAASPVRGRKGNIEFFMWAQKGQADTFGADGEAPQADGEAQAGAARAHAATPFTVKNSAGAPACCATIDEAHVHALVAAAHEMFEGEGT